MIRLDAASVLLQWATGGLLFLWVTTRRRQVGVGYGWLLRISYGLLGLGALVLGRLVDPLALRDAAAAALVAATALALAVSVARRRAGVAGERERRARRAARVDAMVSAAEDPSPRSGDAESGVTPADISGGGGGGEDVKEFPPALDLLAPVFGTVGLVAAALHAGGPAPVALLRTLAGAVFLGSVSDAMLLGHWYLVQPGLGRQPLLELTRWTALAWPLEVGALLLPVGMLSVLTGKVSDGWGGTLGWFWVACAVASLALVAATRAALREPSYSAVMAATGLLYLAILTAFGTDLVARAVLA